MRLIFLFLVCMVVSGCAYESRMDYHGRGSPRVFTALSNTIDSVVVGSLVPILGQPTYAETNNYENRNVTNEVRNCGYNRLCERTRTHYNTSQRTNMRWGVPYRYNDCWDCW